MNTTLKGMLLAAATSVGVLALANASPGEGSGRSSGESTGDEWQTSDVRSAGEIAGVVEREGLRVREIELEREEGRLVYEVKARDATGLRHELYYDARTGERLIADDDGKDDRNDDE